MFGFAPGEIVIVAIIAVFAPLQIWALVDVMVFQVFPTEAERMRWIRIVLIGGVGPVVYFANKLRGSFRPRE